MNFFIFFIIVFNSILLTEQVKQNGLQMPGGDSHKISAYQHGNNSGNAQQESNENLIIFYNNSLESQPKLNGSEKQKFDNSPVHRSISISKANRTSEIQRRTSLKDSLNDFVKKSFRSKDRKMTALRTNKRRIIGNGFSRIGTEPHKDMVFNLMTHLFHSDNDIQKQQKPVRTILKSLWSWELNPFKQRLSDFYVLKHMDSLPALKKTHALDLKMNFESNDQANELSERNIDMRSSLRKNNDYETGIKFHDFGTASRKRRSLPYPNSEILQDIRAPSQSTHPGFTKREQILSPDFYNMISRLLHVTMDNNNVSSDPERSVALLRPEFLHILNAYRKRRFNSWGGKRDALHTKKSSFSSWGGKRSLVGTEALKDALFLQKIPQESARRTKIPVILPDAKGSNYRSRIGKRGFHSWGGKRNTSQNRWINADLSIIDVPDNTLEIYVKSFKRKLPATEPDESFWSPKEADSSGSKEKQLPEKGQVSISWLGEWPQWE